MAKPNREMRRAASRRSHSWWWDSHISPKNSKWLAENLEEMDQNVKRMLKLIEEEGDSFAKKAEMYYEKRPVLISHVEDFYRMYRSLAERYDHLTGELRKNIPSVLQSQGSGSDFGSEPPTPSPDRKPARSKSHHRAAGFDVFLGSGGSSDLSRKGSEGTSSSSDSESESDEATSKNHLLGPFENGDDDNDLHQRIFELEGELKAVKEKLRETDENSKTLSKAPENGNYIELQAEVLELEQQLMVANEKLHISEQEIMRLKYELENNKSSEIICDLKMELDSSYAEKKQLETELESARKEIKSLEAELGLSRKDNETMEAQLKLERERMLEMQERIKGLETDVAGHMCSIEQLRATMDDATRKFSQEKLELEAEVSGLSETCGVMKARLAEFETKGLQLADTITRLEAAKLELLVVVERERAENAERGKHVEELNRNLDALKLKYDMLVAERDEVHAKVQLLVADVSSRDNRIKEMDEHLHRLHLEHAKLIAASENAQKLANDLRTKVNELDKEVERQRAVIAENAEAKREAIRQLCFSLEHYRDGYHQLRQALHGHKRPTVMAA